MIGFDTDQSRLHELILSCPYLRLEAFLQAGATLVYFNMTPVFDMAGDLFSIAGFEEPREISR